MLPEQAIVWDRKLTELSRLEKGWDSYDAKPPTPEALRAARGFLDGLGLAWIVPCSDGGVQVEWHVNGVDVEVTFQPNGEQE